MHLAGLFIVNITQTKYFLKYKNELTYFRLKNLIESLKFAIKCNILHNHYGIWQVMVCDMCLSINNRITKIKSNILI